MPERERSIAAGTFEFETGCAERSDIVLPRLLVEVHGQEPTGLVEKRGINAQCLLPREMSLDGFVGQRDILAGFLVNSFAVLGLGCVESFPVALCLGRVAGPAIRAILTLRVNIFASAKQRSE